MQKTKDEIAEIERHKYFLSEKMGYDVGWEFAEQNWEENYADAWRTTSEGALKSAAAAGQSVTTAEPASCMATAVPRSTNGSIKKPAPSGSVGPLKRFFNRVFART